MKYAIAMTVLLAVVSAGLPAGAQSASPAAPCAKFTRNADGSWTAIDNYDFDGVHIGRGTRLSGRAVMNGRSITTELDQQCNTSPPDKKP